MAAWGAGESGVGPPCPAGGGRDTLCRVPPSLPRVTTGPRTPSAEPPELAAGGGPSDCAGCGACCRRNGSPVVLYNSAYATASGHPYRPAGLPDPLAAEIDERFLGLRRGQEGPGPCLWYDAEAAACRHYQWRPGVCREFEVGSASCLSDRRAEGVEPAGRPGTGRSAAGRSAAGESDPLRIDDADDAGQQGHESGESQHRSRLRRDAGR